MLTGASYVAAMLELETVTLFPVTWRLFTRPQTHRHLKQTGEKQHSTENENRFMLRLA